jgi:hypothetical protein
MFRFIGHRVLTVGTPIGRKMRPKLLSHGAPLVRVKPKGIVDAGVERVPRVVGVRDGLPLLEDDRVLEATNVIWCTGFRPDFPGSTFTSSVTRKRPRNRSTDAGSSPASRGSTSSGCSFSTRCRPGSSPASEGTPSTSPSTSPGANRTATPPRSPAAPRPEAAGPRTADARPPLPLRANERASPLGRPKRLSLVRGMNCASLSSTSVVHGNRPERASSGSAKWSGASMS